VRRAYVLLLIVVGIVVFLVISALLARLFSLDGSERSAITALLVDEAHGNQAGLVARIQGCGDSAHCRAQAAEAIAALKHPGAVAILQTNPSAGFSLGSTQGIARVAWNVGSSLPRTQCVRVRRAGNVLTGFNIELLGISQRIATDGVCTYGDLASARAVRP
jgi:hypothetical protein